MSKTNKINDFGEKIGGARKDLWKAHGGLTRDDLNDLTDYEIKKYAVKSYVWPKPDWEELHNNGVSVEQIAYVKNIYDAIPRTTEDPISYVTGVSKLKDFLESKLQLSKEEFIELAERNKEKQFYGLIRYNTQLFLDYLDIKDIYSNEKVFERIQADNDRINVYIYNKELFYTPEEKFNKNWEIIYIDDTEYRAVDNKLEKLNKDGEWEWILQWGLIRELKKGDYLFLDHSYRPLHGEIYHSKEEADNRKQEIVDTYKTEETKKRKETKSRKSAYKIPALIEIKRIGPACLRDLQADENDFLNELKFRGGEFGNWENQANRQANLNASYEAFKDLATALNISEDSVSLNGSLAIAFGSRGVKGAVAHYEPERNVINLTKMKGAGALAHEWGHALDFCTRNNSEIKKEMKNVIHSLNFKEVDMTPEAAKSKYVETNMADLLKLARLVENRAVNTLAINGIDVDTIYQTLGDRKDFSLNMIEHFGNIKKENDREVSEDDVNQYLNEKFNTDKFKSFDVISYAVTSTLDRASKDYADIAKLDKVKTPTQYVKDSIEMDTKYAKCDKGYWQSDEEMFARAFSCYVQDKLKEKGIRNDYLDGLTEMCCPVPKEERKEIYKAIDKFVDKVKEQEVLRQRDVNYDYKIEKKLHENLPVYDEQDIKLDLVNGLNYQQIIDSYAEGQLELEL